MIVFDLVNVWLLLVMMGDLLSGWIVCNLVGVSIVFGLCV